MFILDSGFSRNTSIFIYIPLFIGMGVAAFFLFANIFLKIVRNRNKKQASNPNRPTTYADIKFIAKDLLLTNDEREFLWEICRQHKVNNFIAYMKNQIQLDELFKIVCNSSSDEQKKSLLFSIRNKIEQDKHNTALISSTKNIQVGQKITYIDANHDQYPSEVLDNVPDGLILIVPKNIYGDELRPNPLSKITLSFETKNYIAYRLLTRVVRYQQRVHSELVVSHTNNLEILHRRNQRRIPYNPVCVFAAVKVSTGGKGKDPTVEYTPLEHRYDGKLLDISSEGCSIQTNLAVKKQQYIYIELKLDDSSIDSLYGLIVETTQNTQTKLNTLHVHFVRMKLETRNKIYRLVYEYM